VMAIALTWRLNEARLILVGVAISAFMAAAMQLLLQWSPDPVLRGFSAWFLGFMPAQWPKTGYWLAGLAAILIGLGFIGRLPRGLDALRQGDMVALNFIRSPQRVRILALLAASLATAVAVGISGAIGFIGLAAPHLARQWFGQSAQTQMIAAMGLGAIVLLIADLLSRLLIAPTVLPLGIMTALLGAPILLKMLLSREYRGPV
jgi:iron complex transport system permease protein